jgi:hypothetical protein
MRSICDSRAKVFVLLAGARHGPTANGCAFASNPDPRDRVRWLGIA